MVWSSGEDLGPWECAYLKVSGSNSLVPLLVLGHFIQSKTLTLNGPPLVDGGIGVPRISQFLVGYQVFLKEEI
jgi:hypothetical protein